MIELPKCIVPLSGNGGLPAYRISNRNGELVIYRHGAHITSWVPTGLQPVLWLSGKSAFEEGMPIRGGIPLCMWLGKGPKGDREPMHGPIRTLKWSLTGALAYKDEISITMEHEGQLAGGKSSFSAALKTTMGQNKLILEMWITNTGGKPFPVGLMFHTYLRVGHAPSCSVVGLNGAEYIDKNLSKARSRQEGNLSLEQPVDRVYNSRSDLTLIDGSPMRRSIGLKKRNSNTTVVWQPGAERSFVDIPQGDWSQFACVETGNAEDHEVLLNTGQTAKTGVTIVAEVD